LILVDANLLIYARVAEFAQHEAARMWLDDQINGLARVALPWPSLLGFLRITTNPRIFQRPEPVDAAWRQVEEWLSQPSVWVPLPTERHANVFGDLLRAERVQGNLIPDAHLAALAIEHGLTLCSTDGDFARFPNLRWVNPLRG
jgi:toxin-antitoxin system PIN domain toxin